MRRYESYTNMSSKSRWRWRLENGMHFLQFVCYRISKINDVFIIAYKIKHIREWP